MSGGKDDAVSAVTRGDDETPAQAPLPAAVRVGFWADMAYYRIAGGTTRYTGELTRALAQRADVELRLFSLYGPAHIRRIAEERGYPQAWSAEGRTPRQWRTLAWQCGWQRKPLLSEIDVMHTPVMLVPPSAKVPLVVTVHDMTAWLFPELHTRRTAWLTRLAFHAARRRGAYFLADSRSTAADLMRIGQLPSDRVAVVPLAADERFRHVDDPAVVSRYGLQAPYILYVGTLEPRKGIDSLLSAFARLGNGDVHLAIVGMKGWMSESLDDRVAALGITARVTFTGFVSDEDLPALISGATAFVYPSLYEGFGLPVLEAMQCGTPVITTDVSSLPEVAANASLMVQPADVEALAHAIRRVVREPALRDELRGRGLAQAAKFSWERTAALTAEAYHHVVRGR
jgi:glycosyltransferase involved in cell wall biosynthesis